MTAYKYQTKKGVRWEYLCNYVDFDGTKKQKHKQGFLTKKEALQAEREFLQTKRFDDKTTFRTVAELYKYEKFKDFKENSKIAVISALTAFDGILDMPLSAFDEDLLKKHLSNVGISQNTKKSYCSVMARIYKFGAEKCKLPKDQITIHMTTTKREYKIYTLEEYQKFRQYLEPMSLVFFDLLYFTGLRKGEAMALDASDVKDRIHVYKSIDPRGEITTPKTQSSIRTIAVPEFLRKELDDYIATLPNYPHQPLFPVSTCYFKRVHDKAERLSGLHHIRIHDFRHSHASYLISQGVNVADISRRLGHASIGITLNTYAHLYKDHDDDIASMLEKSVKNP